MAVKEIRLPIRLRKYQYPLLEAMETKDRAIIVFHRRAGKDILCWTLTFLKALQRKGAYYYIFPSFRQARKAIWEAIDNDGRKFLDYIPRELLASKPNSSEMRIELKNGSIIRLLGSDDFDSIRGTNPIGVVFSEFAYQKPEVWSQIIEPALRINYGWAIFNSTPYGKNHFFNMVNHAQSNPDEWFCQICSISDTGIVKEADLDSLRSQGVSEETIAQEYKCSFDRGVEGSYYGRSMHYLRTNGHITRVHHDEYAKVYTAWDIGIGDSTAIWFFQVIRDSVHFIDYLEASGEGLPFYVRRIDELGKQYGYRYHLHFAPHDMKQRELGTGISRLQMAQELGIDFVVLEATPVDTGIELVRKLLPKCYFDADSCKRGIEALESYQKRYDDKHRVYNTRPLHNWCSHGADAMRYACLGIENHVLRSSGLTPEKIKELKAQARGIQRHPF